MTCGHDYLKPREKKNWKALSGGCIQILLEHETNTLHDKHVQNIPSLVLSPDSVLKLYQNTWVLLEWRGSEEVWFWCCVFSNSSFVISMFQIKRSWSQSVWGHVVVGSHLVERGNGSRGVAAEAVASLDSGDGALEVGAVEQLRELQEAMAQDEQLGRERDGNQSKHSPELIAPLLWINVTVVAEEQEKPMRKS